MQAVAPRRLFDISDDLQALEDLLYEMGGDVTDEEAEAALDSWFATLSHERDVKLDNYAALISEVEKRAEIRKEESKRIRDRAKVDENLAARLKDRLVYFFRVHEIDSISTARYKLTRSQSGKAPVIIKVPDEDLPEEFRRVKVTISADKEAIREAIESGLDDASEYAELAERSEYLRIS